MLSEEERELILRQLVNLDKPLSRRRLRKTPYGKVSAHYAKRRSTAAEVRSRNRRIDCAVIYSETVLADLQQITEFIARENARSCGKICESVGGSG